MRHAMRTGLLVLLGLAMTGPGLAAPLSGDWGGNRTMLRLSPEGGELRQDCADGRLTGPVRPDAQGRFTATGTYDLHGAGPQREDARPAAARYDGHFAGDTLHLTIVPAAGEPQKLTLVAGRAIKLIRCL